MTRSEAKERGLETYFTGKPCIRGHRDSRNTKTGVCKGCSLVYASEWRLANPERAQEIRTKHLENNREAINSRRRDKYADNPHPHRQSVKNWAKSNLEKVSQRNSNHYQDNRDSRLAYNKKWKRENPELVRANIAKRRSAKLNRTPPWADLDKIKQVYLDCPEGMTVDHIIPLQGKRVSGLHVHTNLQYLTPSENSSKGNKFIYD